MPLEWVFQEKLNISNLPRFQQLLRISTWILTSRCHMGRVLLSRVWLRKLRTVSHLNDPFMLAFSIFHGPCKKQSREGHSKSQRLHLPRASLARSGFFPGLARGFWLPWCTWESVIVTEAGFWTPVVDGRFPNNLRNICKSLIFLNLSLSST